MNIAVLEPLGIAQETLEEIFNERLAKDAKITYYPDRSEDVATLIERSADADIVVFSNIPYPKEVIEQCPKLKAIMIAFTGVDHVDIEACKKRHITVCNCSGYASDAVAELVFGMAISFYRNLGSCEKRAREHGTRDGLIGCELKGRTFGIIGTGEIGLRVAAIAEAFGTEVLAYSRTVRYLPDISSSSYVSLEELLRRSDIVSIHVPLTKDTYHMISKKELQWMKPDALLINTARGAVVDEDALYDALIHERIGGACIDVLDQEPPFDPQRPILHAPRVMVTPHIGFATVEAMESRALTVAYNIKGFMEGIPVGIIHY